MKKTDVKITLSIKSYNYYYYCKVDDYTVWFSGYIINTNRMSFINKLIKMLNSKSLGGIDKFYGEIKNIQGHYSCIISNKEKLLCCVDRVRTIPIFYTINNKEVIVSNCASNIESIIGKREYDKKAALEIAMSGYTIGKKTLHSKILQLCAGEFLVVNNNELKIRKYYQYSPWIAKERSKAVLKKELTEISRSILEDMVTKSDGRQIVVPLSAGNDSRFIASGLKEIGAKNVFCFSYGIENNFEVKTAKKVAEHLDYPWLYIPLSISIQKKIFLEDSFKEFWRFSDTFSNHPVLIDYSAVKLLDKSDKISKEAIFVNGNSGDFITGGHINPTLSKINSQNLSQLVEYIVNKHYSLWDYLKTKSNVYNIALELEEVVKGLINYHKLPLSNLPEIAESMEWSGRQSKIVTTTQRSYEFHGYEWRLPMWDSVYMDFWESVERKYKVEQSLYVETLLENNWGGVWDGVAVNNYSIASNKLQLLRNLAKLFFIFSDHESWHHFDKRFFSYYYDETAATAIVPYSDVIFNRYEARNRNSWIVKKYLAEKDINVF